jgi:hypothetical protein
MRLPQPPQGFKGALPDFNNGHWQFPAQMGKGSGFVYVIRDNFLKRFYLGKKSFKTRSGVETGWRKYTSSSNILNEMFEHRPREEFEFFCLEEYKTKGTVGYAETWSLCLVEAPTTDMWYNKRIEKVTWKVKEMITDRHKERLNRILNMEAPNGN